MEDLTSDQLAALAATAQALVAPGKGILVSVLAREDDHPRTPRPPTRAFIRVSPPAPE